MNSSQPGKKLNELNKSFDEFMAEDSVSTGATQRVKLTDIPQEPSAPAGRTPRQPQKKKNAMSKKERTAVIVLACIALLLILILVPILLFGGNNRDDNGRILHNVYVAGVNIGGMTKEQAKEALSEVAKDYAELDMVVELPNSQTILTPSNTGARLDVDAVIEAAYALGRTGSSAEQDKAHNATSHSVSVLPYLNLNTDYINSVVTQLGKDYSTLRSDPIIDVKDNPPPANADQTDTTIVYQTMYIFTGTAEYNMNTGVLYQQIMDAYDSHIFEVTGQCSVTPPNLSVIAELEKKFKEYCRPAVDADIDENFNVTAEVYGYGFVLDDIKEQLATARYGETLEIPMTFVRPDITAEDLAGNLFKDVLGSYELSLQADNNLITNLKQVCKAINGLILKTEQTFSFNELIGETTRQRGYKPFSQFVGKTYTENYYGGGVDQAASALYVCTLLADLEVLERHAHSYAPNYIQPGLDADILYGTRDFRFQNSTENPIRILAEYKNGKLIVQLLGTDTKNYTVTLEVREDKVYEPSTLLLTMPPINANNYTNGQVLETPITGYDVSVYKICTPKPVEEDPTEPTDPTEPSEPTEPSMPTEPSEPVDPSNPTEPTEPEEDPMAPDEVLVGQNHYDKRNAIVVSIQEPTVEPTEPTEPSESTEPSASTEPPVNE